MPRIRQASGVQGAAARGFFIAKQLKKWAQFYAQKPQKLDARIAILHQSTNYFHFLSESIAALAQVRAFARENNVEIDFYTMDSSVPFQAQMWEILGIPKEKILPPHPRKLYQAKALIIPTLTANTETVEYRSRILWSRAFALPFILRDFYSDFAARIAQDSRNLDSRDSSDSDSHDLQDSKQDSRDSQDSRTSNPTRKIFLTRPKSSNRNFENLSEIEGIFRDFGYEIILPDALSLINQARLCHEAKILASMHGAGLANAFFMQKGACVFELFSAHYFDPGAQSVALLMHLRYFYAVGRTKNLDAHPQQESAYFAPEALKTALARIESYL